MSTKPIDKYLPQKEETTLTQGHVPKRIFHSVNQYRESKGLTWNELLEALFKRLLDEVKS